MSFLLDSMTTDKPIQKILILSDHEGLSRAVELNIQAIEIPGNIPFKTVRSVPNTMSSLKTQITEDNISLIVVALSSSNSEPAMALAKASLIHRVGFTPILIISQKENNTTTGNLISQMEYPFDIDQLRNAVRDSLRTFVDESIYVQ